MNGRGSLPYIKTSVERAQYFALNPSKDMGANRSRGAKRILLKARDSPGALSFSHNTLCIFCHFHKGKVDSGQPCGGLGASVET